MEIWEDLSLKLRKEEAEPIVEGQHEAQTRFMINHPDLSSESLSPKNIPCATFLTVNCDIYYGSRPRKTTTKQRRREEVSRLPRKRVCDRYSLRNHPRATDRALGSGKTPSQSGGSIQTSSGQAPSLIRDEYAPRPTQEWPSPSFLGPTPASTQNFLLINNNDGSPPNPDQDTHEDVALLIKVALHKLLGVKKAHHGVRVARDFPGPSLIELAPAVWNIRYLQVHPFFPIL